MSIYFGKPPVPGNGGTVSYNGVTTLHTFTSSSSYTHAIDGWIDVLVIGGGGQGGVGGGFAVGGHGGAGATLLTKFVKLTAGVEYPITVGSGNGSSSIFNVPGANGIPAKTAAGGGQGAIGDGPGASQPLASGGGGSAWRGPNPGGTGAGVYGIGFPGFSSGPGSGGGGGAGSGGPNTTNGYSGGSGVPIVYFTNNPAHNNVCAGGPNNGQFGSGGTVNGSGTPGAVFIRYT